MKKIEKIIEYGIYLFVFLLPWQTRLILHEGNLNGYWEYGTFSVYATEILLWMIFLLTSVWWTMNKIKNQKSKDKIKSKIQNPNLLICLSAFLLYSFLSFFWADSKSLALYTWHWLAEGIGLFLVLRTIKFDVLKFAWAFVSSALIQASLGIWQFLFQSTFASKWLGMAFHDPAVSGTIVVETALRRWLRAYGSLPHPNMLAGFLAAAMFLVIWLYQKKDYGSGKIFLPSCFAILSFGLFVTFSKSVIASFLLVLILWWVISYIQKQSEKTKIDLFKFTLLFLVIAVIFSVVFWEPVSTRLAGSERLEIKSTSERINYFGEAWQLIKAHPFLGVSLGNYTLAMHNEINPALQSFDYQPVHNIYLLVFVELGAIGFLIFLAIILYTLYLILNAFRKGGEPLNFIFGLAFLLLLAAGLFDHYFLTIYFGVVFFWLVLGITQKVLDKSFDKE